MVKCLGFPVLEGVRGSLLLLTAWLTHHLRDSIRRGLWFCPWGSLKPTPYWLYLTAMALLPLMLQPVLSLTQSAPRSSRDVSGSDFISSFWWISGETRGSGALSSFHTSVCSTCPDLPPRDHGWVCACASARGGRRRGAASEHLVCIMNERGRQVSQRPVETKLPCIFIHSSADLTDGPERL